MTRMMVMIQRLRVPGQRSAPAGPSLTLGARIASNEAAYRVQATAPEARDFSRWTVAIKGLYGVHDKRWL
jgi:hypothetical protein